MGLITSCGTLSLLLLACLQSTGADNCSEVRELQRASSDTTLLGYYEVQCSVEDESQYERKQCWPSTGRCWCVDALGATILGSHVNPGQPPIMCETFGWCESVKRSLLGKIGENEMPPLGMHLPSCDSNGNFASKQTWGSTGQSWCAVANGNKIPGTVTGPTDTPWDCENLPACLAAEGSLAHLMVDGYYPLGLNRPECDGQGMYKGMQCHASTGYCWCVDRETGEEITGTSKGPGDGPLDCNAVLVEEVGLGAAGPGHLPSPDTPCRSLFTVQRTHLEKQDSPLLGFWTVSCEADGSFSPSQCHPSSGHCWCVDMNGKEILGSRSLPGSPKVACRDEPQNCVDVVRQAIREAGVYMLVGMWTPDCEEDGKFMAKQCWDSTGQCWCVTPSGMEIPFSRRGPTESPHLLDCVGIEAPPPVPGRLRDTAGYKMGTSEEDIQNNGGKPSNKISLLVIVAVLAALLIAVVIGGIVFYKSRQASPPVGPRYSEVNNMESIPEI